MTNVINKFIDIITIILKHQKILLNVLLNSFKFPQKPL